MDERRATTWLELQELLFADAWNDRLGLFRSSYAYRGCSDARADLSSGLVRIGGDPELERQLMRAFRKYATQDAVPHDTAWDWLALGQHHGLPTRLLDWTYSPYVALHFATHNREKYDRDGVVWCIDYVRAHEQLPGDLRTQLREEGANVFTTELLDRAAPRLTDLERYGDELVLFVEPPSFDARIVNQYALFSVISRADGRLDEWAERQDGIAQRVVVPAELKWEVRDKLDQANITERVLFPGLDGLSRWLARYYEPRRRGGARRPVPGTET
ncbi:MAG TPA: FRG domain-containing protein [Gaiellaceae bacterium]|nr:FRG domain-containing protein [Gaiellaceae bacterium]